MLPKDIFNLIKLYNKSVVFITHLQCVYLYVTILDDNENLFL